jgi:hypothetical protein
VREQAVTGGNYCFGYDWWRWLACWPPPALAEKPADIRHDILTTSFHHRLTVLAAHSSRGISSRTRTIDAAGRDENGKAAGGRIKSARDRSHSSSKAPSRGNCDRGYVSAEDSK